MLNLIKVYLKNWLTELQSTDINVFLFKIKQQTEVSMKNKDNVKFQYIRSDDGKLCLSIGTEIIHSNKNSHVFWSVAFKHPKDKFDKRLARQVVMDNFTKMDFVSGELILDKTKYSRYDIVMKIMMSLHINEVYMTPEYRKMVVDYMYTYS
jgi:hypothetical protein